MRLSAPLEAPGLGNASAAGAEQGRELLQTATVLHGSGVFGRAPPGAAMRPQELGVQSCVPRAGYTVPCPQSWVPTAHPGEPDTWPHTHEFGCLDEGRWVHSPMPQELGASMVVGLGARSPTPGAGCHADRRSLSCALAGGGTLGRAGGEGSIAGGRGAAGSTPSGAGNRQPLTGSIGP